MKPESIDRLALELSHIGIKVPPRDTAFFQSAVSKWLASAQRIDIDGIRKKLTEYALTQDATMKDEWYCTPRSLAEGQVGRFLDWLQAETEGDAK